MAPRHYPLSLASTVTALFALFTAVSSAHLLDSKSTQDVPAIIPPCAQECFRSFLLANFQGARCSSDSAFECICEQTGSSGFTAGEGAVQCLVAAKSLGICFGTDASQTALGRAYNMCSGQPNAVTPTHSTIQATLQLGPSSKLSAPNQGGSASVTATTLSTVTTRRPLPSPTTATLTAPPPLPTSSEDPPPGGLAADSGRVEQGKVGNGRLSVAQIAGLSAGLAAAFGIAILLICLARRRRKKDFPGIETGFFMKSDRLKAISRRFTVYPRGHNISAPIHGSPCTRFPMGPYAPTATQSNSSSSPPMVEKMSSPELIARGGLGVTAAAIPSQIPMAKSSTAPTNEMRQGAGAVGLAISKTRSRRDDQAAPAPNQRRPDGKPKLSINTSTIANNVSGSNQTIRPVPATQRGEEEESPMTEFEEDGGDISPKQIWYPPSAAPQSSNTVYIADKFGNWVLADERQRRRISRVELDSGNPIVRNLTGPQKPSDPPSRDLELPPPFKPNRLEAPASALSPPAEIRRQAGTATSTAVSTVSSRSPQSKTLTPASVYASEGGPWNRTPTRTPPVPSNSLVPKPLSTRQPSRNYRAGPDLGPWAPPAPTLPTAYSPVLNPFLDTNDVSPVRRAGNSAYDLTGRIPAPQGQNLFRPSRMGQTAAPSPTPMPGLRRGATSSNPQLMATPIVAPASRAFVQPYSAGSITPTTNRYSYIGDPSSPQQTSGAARSALLEKRLGPDRPSQLSNLTVTPVTSRPSVQSDISQPGPWRRMMRDAEGGARGGDLPSTPTWRPLLTPERRGDALYLSLR